MLSFRGPDDQLVVDVGDVDDPGHLVAEVGEVALDGVEDDRADHVADVAGLVDRRPADVHADLAGLDVWNGSFLPGQRVVDAQGHGNPFDNRDTALPVGSRLIEAFDQDDRLAADGLAAADGADVLRRSWP